MPSSQLTSDCFTVFVQQYHQEGDDDERRTSDRIVPFVFCSNWSNTTLSAYAAHFCEREAIPQFDCSTELARNAREYMQRRRAEAGRAINGDNNSEHDPPMTTTTGGRMGTPAEPANDTSSDTIVYFLHVHKAGGTAVCDTARANGLSRSSNNCNPETQESIRRLLGTPTEQAGYMRHVLRQLRSSGPTPAANTTPKPAPAAAFVANELGLPLELTDGDHSNGTPPMNVVRATMVRDPASRLYSHFAQAVRQLQYALTLRRSAAVDAPLAATGEHVNVRRVPVVVPARAQQQVGAVTGNADEENGVGANEGGASTEEWYFNSHAQHPPQWFLTNYQLQRRTRLATTTYGVAPAGKGEDRGRRRGAGGVCAAQVAVARNFLAWLGGTPDNMQFRLVCGAFCANVGRGRLSQEHFTFVRQRLDRQFATVGTLEA